MLVASLQFLALLLFRCFFVWFLFGSLLVLFLHLFLLFVSLLLVSLPFLFYVCVCCGMSFADKQPNKTNKQTNKHNTGRVAPGRRQLLSLRRLVVRFLCLVGWLVCLRLVRACVITFACECSCKTNHVSDFKPVRDVHGLILHSDVYSRSI